MDQAQQQPPEYDEETLERFAAAWSEVREIREEYLGQIEAAEDSETAQALQAEAQDAMTEAVTEAGVEVAQYNQIAGEMAQSPELADRIRSLADSG